VAISLSRNPFWDVWEMVMQKNYKFYAYNREDWIADSRLFASARCKSSPTSSTP
jgi:hypothetical protein